jgi:hypothetical protein
MLATLQRKNSRQPQQAPRLDRSNPLTAGLAMLQVLGQHKGLDLARNVNNAFVGTKAVPYAGGLATGFGSTFGAGTTDRISTAFTGALVNRSYFFTARRNGAGGGSLGRIFDKTNGSSGQFLYWTSGSTLLSYGFFLGGVEQVLQFPASTSATAVGVDFNLLLTHSVSGTTQTITAYLNGVQLAVTPPNTGTLTDAAATVLTIGNRASDNVRNWDGLIGFAAVWDRIVSPSEALAISANPWQLLSAGPTSYPVPDASGSTNTQVAPGAGGIAITGFAPTVARTANQAIAPSAGALVVSGYAPAVVRTANQAVSPAAGALAITGYAPSVTRSASGSVSPGAGSLVIAGYAPTVTRTSSSAVAPGAGAMSITGYAPSVGQTAPVAPASEYGATIIRAAGSNSQVPALVASVAALGGTLVGTFNAATIMRASSVNSVGSMSAGAINQTAELL